MIDIPIKKIGNSVNNRIVRAIVSIIVKNLAGIHKHVDTKFAHPTKITEEITNECLRLIIYVLFQSFLIIIKHHVTSDMVATKFDTKIAKIVTWYQSPSFSFSNMVINKNFYSLRH